MILKQIQNEYMSRFYVLINEGISKLSKTIQMSIRRTHIGAMLK